MMLWSGGVMTGWGALGDCGKNEEGGVEEVGALPSAVWHELSPHTSIQAEVRSCLPVLLCRHPLSDIGNPVVSA